jgi:capsular polysaccharide biosynthesis protein
MTEVKTGEEMSLNLTDLLGLLWKRLWIILLAAVIVGSSCFVYNYVTYTERYTSTAQIYVLNTEMMEGASASTTAYYFQLALTVVEDCKELLLSETVLTRVADELSLDVSPATLRSMIKITNEVDSRILKVSVTTGNPELSCDIANEVAEQGVYRIREIMKVNQMSVYESGKVSQIPSNDVDWKVPVMLGFVAALLVYGVCLLLMLVDDKVTSAEDVENYLGLTVLGDIPHKSDNPSKKRGGRYYGKYYGKYVGKN